MLRTREKAAIYKELALKDILTGLYSRNAYDEWERDNQHPNKTAIVMLDLNKIIQWKWRSPAAMRSMMTMWIGVLWIQERGQIRLCMKISVC